MIQYEKIYEIEPQWRDWEWIIEKADLALKAPILHITDVRSSRSEGGPHDYYSNGDYGGPTRIRRMGCPISSAMGRETLRILTITGSFCARCVPV